jgi:hypothetical protein
MMQAPYPADTRAKGWRFELDYEQIEQSSTWALAGPEGQAWALKLWLTAWRQVPCGSLPGDEEVIGAALGMTAKQWARHRKALMRGWSKADDGRLYHPTLTARVVEMLGKRRSDADRKAADRARKAQESTASPPHVTPDSDATPASVHPESGTDNRPPSSSFPTVKKKARSAPPPVVPPSALVAVGFSCQQAVEFIDHKANVKAPLTARAWADHLKESAAAGWTPMAAAEKVMAKNWKGFEAKYVANEKPGQITESFAQRAARERVEATVPGIAARPSKVTEIFDVTARLVG